MVEEYTSVGITVKDKTRLEQMMNEYGLKENKRISFNKFITILLDAYEKKGEKK
jgi:hypothetical protein